ncbi:NAD-dependent protein deacylase Sirt4-like [Apis cerana]|uniref:NAD-dependent ADP-ribosyltransferase sirtuin-4 n=1 Tax=Apis cerana cerana TaxID=94128 RepID=A0A2A3EB70_APICC|nr:NAD-dependent protein deacylase Sirt4-like [Apis cerana]PBC28968.1 NAD-dependent ADP-ribosyltransferase sirtuin-4 [Apis cerana cerana]
MSIICMRSYKSANIIETLLCRRYISDFSFVPKCEPIKESYLLKLKDFIDNHNNICVLTGAGISTESGIPDYRSQDVGLYARSNHKPVLYKDFCNSDAIRRRYWARNYIGWPRFSSIKPNNTHKILTKLENANKIRYIVTQNVDNLHTKAGSKKVIELHGTAFRVMCLNCNERICRYYLQDIFDRINPNMTVTSQMIRPDGDVELTQEQVEKFKVPICEKCDGILKPDIIFFGDNVPHQIVENIKYNIEHSDSLLIIGTTLTTFSSYRIALQANNIGKPIAILNIGKTRVDNLAKIKVEGRCSNVLSRIYSMLN